MSYACFMCKRGFNAATSCKQHLMDAHDWKSENEGLNGQFLRCPYCDGFSRNYNAHLFHVLSSCPTTQQNYLYWNRHVEVLGVICEAIIDHYRYDGTWKILSVLDSNCTLPLGIRNEPGVRGPDILVYSRARKVALIIELSVPWETNMPQARLDAHRKMEYWYDQFEERGYSCYCYSVEVGARGMVSNSFHECLSALGLDEDQIDIYSQRCADTAFEYSNRLLQGEP